MSITVKFVMERPDTNTSWFYDVYQNGVFKTSNFSAFIEKHKNSGILTSYHDDVTDTKFTRLLEFSSLENFDTFYNDWATTYQYYEDDRIDYITTVGHSVNMDETGFYLDGVKKEINKAWDNITFYRTTTWAS